MSESDKSNNQHPCGFMRKLGLNPDDKGKIPCPVTICSATSYGLLAVNMFNQDLISKFSPSRDLTNFFLAGSLIGGTIYLHSRPHIAAVEDPKNQILYSIYGSTMVTMGSLLLWAMTRVLLPDNAALRTVAAVGSSVILLKTGVGYVASIDNAVKKASSK